MKEYLNRILRLRSRISTQIYLGIGGAVMLTVAASLVAWFSFNRVNDAVNLVNEGSVPELTASFGVAYFSGNLVEAGPRLTSAVSQEEFEEIAEEVEVDKASFELQLSLLQRQGTEPGRFQRIRSHADTLISNIDAISAEMTEYFWLAETRNLIREELVSLRTALEERLVPAIDDQLFYTVTGYRRLGQPSAETEVHFNEGEFGNYRILSELLSDANIGTEVLANAFTVSDPTLLEPLRERFESVAGRIQRNLTFIENTPYYPELQPRFDRLYQIGMGESSAFNLLEQELRLLLRQNSLTSLNRDIAIDLGDEVNALVADSQATSQVATAASSQAILTGRTLLLVISALSVVGALLLAWLFVGRFLLRRLQRLSDRMVHMASGDLESEVSIDGKDEIAEMASALEVFRRHALEVQRLNLVEKLAEELQGKNDQLENLADELQGKNGQLETVLGDLQTAQDQIVMREKLAALGELTAGVAHEIRNPLNFVKNFSEASVELLEEFRETLEESEDGQLDKEQMELIEEICDDLDANLGRISSHGSRANSIVESMLSMGRGTSERQMVDLNGLVEEHARLAYHSARATDSDFQLDLKHEPDPNMGDVEIVPQDMGRVFLNLVNNAGYAADQKRRALEEDPTNDRFFPLVTVTTERKEETAVVTIRDNGTGMPQEVVEKIFNPFFTTKPTDQGTGLGLAICNDIVRSHGGTIEVESKEGEYTIMTVEIPLVAPIEGIEEAVEEAIGG